MDIFFYTYFNDLSPGVNPGIRSSRPDGGSFPTGDFSQTILKSILNGGDTCVLLLETIKIGSKIFDDGLISIQR